MLLRHRFGPHAAQRAAQAGGELGALLQHLGHGHAEREIDLGPPARPA
jgi:hypothetical protein